MIRALGRLIWIPNHSRPGVSGTKPPCRIQTTQTMQELCFLEFFAGEGAVWRAVRADSIDAVGVDITYVRAQEGRQNPFDILSNAGMAFHP